MKKLLRELFYVPKYGKVTEKALFGRLSVYITVIVLCMAGMAFTAYAYFSASVLSGNNSIQAAHFDVEISISEAVDNPGAKTQGTPVTVKRDGANEYHAALTGGKEYLVTVRATGTANTGFVLLTVGNKQYFTQQLFRDTADILTFSLLPAEDMEVAFMPHFGTSSRYEDYQNGVVDPFYVKEKDEVQLVLPAATDGVQNEDGEEQEQDATTENNEQNDDQNDEQQSEIRYHLIQNGENLQAIANLYQVDMNELMKLNGIMDANLILTGDRLILPENAAIPLEMTTPETTVATQPSVDGNEG